MSEVNRSKFGILVLHIDESLLVHNEVGVLHETNHIPSNIWEERPLRVIFLFGVDIDSYGSCCVLGLS